MTWGSLHFSLSVGTIKMKQNRSSWVCISLLSLTSTIFFVNTEVSAQTGSGADALEEVVVTATRRTTDLQSTALAASVLSGEDLVDKGINTLEFIQYSAPSVKISHYGSANVFNIRGVGRTQVDIDVPSGVVIYRDGAPTIAGYFQGEPYFDIKSIEVLRGPQGTFVGKSASGGAVFINTNDPNLEGNLSGTIEGGYGNNDTKEVTGIINIPVNDTLALRGSFRHLDSDNFYDAITGNYTGDPGERDLNSFKAGLLWVPNDQFTAKIKFDYHDLDYGGNIATSYGADRYTPDVCCEFAYEDESLRVVGDLNYVFDNGVTLRSLSAYQTLDTINNLDVNGSNPVYYQFKSGGTVDIISEEINLISPDDQRARWVLGFLYYKQDAFLPDWTQDGFTFYTDFGLGTTFPWFTTHWDKHEDEWSIFGHVAYDLTDQLEVEAGLRYSDYSTDQETAYLVGFGNVAPDGATAGIFGFPATATTQSLSDGQIDGQIALNYTVNKEHFLYGLVSRGHTQAGINIFPPFNSYVAMEVINYEAGWKANWMDDQVRTQVTVFYQDIDDFHLNFQRNVGPGQDNRNAPGNTEIYGIELSGQAHINNWHIDANLSWLDSDIGEFANARDPFRSLTAGMDVFVDRTGARVPYLSEISTNLGVSYDFLWSGGDYILTPRYDIAYSSETQSKIWDTPIQELKSRTLSNINVLFRPSSEKWAVTFWMTNVFDKEYTAAVQNAGGAVGELIYAGRPQEYGLRLRYNF